MNADSRCERKTILCNPFSSVLITVHQQFQSFLRCVRCASAVNFSGYTRRMSVNAELARIFSEMAAVMELTGANPFKVGAYNNAVRTIGGLTADLGELACEKKKLTAIAGIGDGIAAKIMEFCQTGKVHEHDELVQLVPPGVLHLTRIPGVGA